MSATVTHPFRVHLAGGLKVEVQATSADQARKIVQAKQAGQITKIKRVRAA